MDGSDQDPLVAVGAHLVAAARAAGYSGVKLATALELFVNQYELAREYVLGVESAAGQIPVEALEKLRN